MPLLGKHSPLGALESRMEAGFQPHLVTWPEALMK